MSEKSSKTATEKPFSPFGAPSTKSQPPSVTAQPFNPFGVLGNAGNGSAVSNGGVDPLGTEMLSSVINVRQGDLAYSDRDKGFLKTVFGVTNAREDRLAQHDLAQTSQICNFLEKKLALECEAIYLRCQDEVNSWLTRHRLASRRDLITFATQEMEKLKESLEDRRAGFTAIMRRRMARWEENQDITPLIQAEINDMETDCNEHLRFLRDLETLFKDAVVQRIG